MKKTTLSSHPFFSIIIPVYNSERQLNKCVESVLQQTFLDFELICIDDGSTDGSARILDNFADKDARVSVLHTKNMGVANARNMGLEVARGRYIYYMDSDDWVAPKYLSEVHLKAVKYNPDIVITDAFIHKKGRRKYISSLKGMLEGEVNNKDSYDTVCTFYLCGLCTVWNLFILKSMLNINKIEFVDLYHADDALFCLNVYLCAKKIYYYKMAGYHYVVWNESISHRYIGENILQMQIKLYENQLNIEKINCGIDYTKIINTYLLNSLIRLAERYVYNPQNNMTIMQKSLYLKNVVNNYPYSNAIENYDKKYLGKTAKLYVLDHKISITMIFILCYIRRLMT